MWISASSRPVWSGLQNEFQTSHCCIVRTSSQRTKMFMDYLTFFDYLLVIPSNVQLWTKKRNSASFLPAPPFCPITGPADKQMVSSSSYRDSSIQTFH